MSRNAIWFEFGYLKFSTPKIIKITCLNEVFNFTRIWVTENFFNIHTVKDLPSKRACILYQCDSKLMENRLSGMLCKIRDLEIFSSFSLSWVSVFLLSKYLGINFNFSVWRLQFKVLDREFRSGFPTLKSRYNFNSILL